MPRDLSARTRLITTKQRLFAKELTWPSGELFSFGAEGAQRMTASHHLVHRVYGFG